jgi:hypothetical protein
MSIRSNRSFRQNVLATLLPVLVLGVSPGAASAAKLAPPGANERDKSEAGVRATEDHWQLAEETGDTDFLAGMLAAEYRSVNPDGSVHAKEAIIAGAAKNRGSDEAKRKTEAYLEAHPSGTRVTMHGDVAVVSFFDPALGPDKGIRSSDIFQYVDGAWHAEYSQHSNVGRN